MFDLSCVGLMREQTNNQYFDESLIMFLCTTLEPECYCCYEFRATFNTNLLKTEPQEDLNCKALQPYINRSVHVHLPPPSTAARNGRPDFRSPRRPHSTHQFRQARRSRASLPRFLARSAPRKPCLECYAYRPLP